jgi:RNA polymerase sigma factor (sigma-70 family)
LKRHAQRDDELWDSFKSGNYDAFASMYACYYKTLYAYGRKFIADDTQAEDAIQDLFINLWRTRENLSAVNNIKYYLFRCLRRDLHRLGEKEKRFEKVDLTTLLDIQSGSLEEIALGDDEDELAKNLTLLLQKLPRRQYEAIMLRYYEDFTIPEIASIMDVSEKTVRNTLFNAMGQLRQHMRFLSPFVKILLYVLSY